MIEGLKEAGDAIGGVGAVIGGMVTLARAIQAACKWLKALRQPNRRKPKGRRR